VSFRALIQKPVKKIFIESLFLLLVQIVERVKHVEFFFK